VPVYACMLGMRTMKTVNLHTMHIPLNGSASGGRYAARVRARARVALLVALLLLFLRGHAPSRVAVIWPRGAGGREKRVVFHA